MPTPYEIPLSPTPQTFTISLGGTTYRLTVWWNDMAACWTVDIYDSDGSTKILVGVPLVTGCDLLAPYSDLDFGGELIAQVDGDINAVPTFDNLGTTGHLYFVTLP